MSLIAIDARKLDDFGIGSYTHSLLEGLQRSASDDRFLILSKPGARLPELDQRFEVRTTSAAPYGLWEHWRIASLAKSAGADLLHCPHYVLPLAWQRAAIVTIHDLIHLLFPEYLPNRAAYVYARSMLRRAYRRASLLLTVSESSKRDLLEHFGGNPERIRVIPNHIPDSFYQPIDAQQLAHLRRRLSLPARFVLHVGNRKAHKNVGLLVRALGELQRAGEACDVALVLVGGSEAQDAPLCELAASLGLSLLTLGRLSEGELRGVYQLAELLAFPSLYEGFGLPLIEAMASGTAVLAADTSALPEVCGDAAVLLDPHDLDAWKQSLGRLLETPSLREELISRGRRRAADFRCASVGERVAPLYRELLEASRGG